MPSVSSIAHHPISSSHYSKMKLQTASLLLSTIVPASLAFTQISRYSNVQHYSIISPSSTCLQMNKKKSGAKKKSARSRTSSSSKGFAGALRDLQQNTFPYSGSIRPGKQSPKRIVPNDTGITFPDYALDSIVSI